jgi:hypothetical protein
VKLAAPILFLAAAFSLHAQPIQQVSMPPDCQIFFTFTTAGQTSPLSPNHGLDNRTAGCTTWNFYYVSSGFATLDIRLESAPNNNGVPGAYATGFAVQPNIITGCNPCTNTTGGFLWTVGSNAWVQVHLFAKTGSGVINGAAYGWKIPNASANGTAAPSANVNVNQWGGAATTLGQKVMASSVPVTLASDQSPIQTATICDQQALFNLSVSGNTRIVTGTPAKSVRVCHISFSTGDAENVKLVEGTGATCAGAPADVTGLYTSITAMVLQPLGSLVVGSGLDLCLNQTGTQALGGLITYAVF